MTMNNNYYNTLIQHLQTTLHTESFILYNSKSMVHGTYIYHRYIHTLNFPFDNTLSVAITFECLRGGVQISNARALKNKEICYQNCHIQ